MSKQIIRTEVYKGILIKSFVILLFLNFTNLMAQSKTVAVSNFDKVIISPHIQVTFREGDKEAVIIEQNKEPFEKLNIEVVNHTLRIYLEDAKMVTKSERIRGNNGERRVSKYKGTVVSAIVIYKKLEKLSLRGEQTFVLESPLKMSKLSLNIYGESQVYINEVALDNLYVSIYGESYLEIKKGSITRQKFISYGESTINTIEVNNQSTKITAYGTGSFRFNITDDLKITSYGEATVAYKGNPTVRKGIVIGETKIENIR